MDYCCTENIFVSVSHLPCTDRRWSPNIFLSSPSSTLSEAKLERQLYAREFLRNLIAQSSAELYISSISGGSGGNRGRMPLPCLQHIPLVSFTKSLTPQCWQGLAVLRATPALSRAVSRAFAVVGLKRLGNWILHALLCKTPHAVSQRSILPASTEPLALRWAACLERRRLLISALLTA